MSKIGMIKRLFLVGMDPPFKKIWSLRCFWSYPFGHIWYRTKQMSSYDRVCLLCDRKSTKSTYDMDWFHDLGVMKGK